METFPVESVLVTGSDRGVGLGLVTRFLEKQDPPEWIFATTLDLEGFHGKKLRRLASSHPNLVVLQLDIRDLKSIEAAVQKVEEHVKGNGLTLLINNAGILVKFTFLATETAENMARLYNTNTIGTLQVSQALPLLKTAALRSPKEGLSCSKAAIVNISSDFGSIEKMAGWCLSQVVSYRCSKTALNMLTRCQSLEYKQFGVLCLSIHPGWVKTSMGTLLVPTTVKDSTTGIVKVLSAVTERDSGSFLDWEGNTVPW
ncbi:PREDICTED: C-factor-like [Gekko japonicus]|uniref:C-factor-like n=1 Tax=Gekko japonicus TaxID=146911 RepID=A0ABM1JQZ1_GEKJA|nr:PREDICTED: C-factor-like [Gekko japonicus]